jgi:hypothetical protein
MQSNIKIFNDKCSSKIILLELGCINIFIKNLVWPKIFSIILVFKQNKGL